LLEFDARWWKTRFELDWQVRGFDQRAKLYLTFLNPYTGFALASEIYAGNLAQRHWDDTEISPGFFFTDGWLLQIRVEPVGG